MPFRSLTVFSYDVDDLLREIAKKNSETDITLYSRKNGDLITTFIVPSKFPDKISSLTDSLFPSDIALVRVEKMNRELGEVLIGMSLMKIQHTVFILGQSVDRAFFSRVLGDAGIASFEFTDLDGISLAEKIESFYRQREGGTTKVVVDQFFKVKSVGTVVLGFVTEGTVRKHQELKASYSDRIFQVRSIQMQDIEVEEAEAGSRVGLALKNADLDDLDRGVILSESESGYFTEIKGEVSLHKSVRREFPDTYEVFIADSMRYQRGTISGEELKMDRKFADTKKEYVLVNPNVTPRIIGTFRPARTN